MSLRTQFEAKVIVLANQICEGLEQAGHARVFGPDPGPGDEPLWWIHNEKFDIVIGIMEQGVDKVCVAQVCVGSNFHSQIRLCPKGNDLNKHWTRFAAECRVKELIEAVAPLLPPPAPKRPLPALQRLLRGGTSR